MTADWRVAGGRARSARRWRYLLVAALALVVMVRPASADYCRIMPDGQLYLSTGPFAEDVSGPCPYYLDSYYYPYYYYYPPADPQPQPQPPQRAAPPAQFTTPMGPFTTGQIGPMTTVPLSAPAIPRRR
jgi:hypothetical protein